MSKRPPSLVIPSRLMSHLETEGGVFAMLFDPGRQEEERWFASYHFGEEEEGSEMAAGAAYGLGPTATEAFSGMLRDAGLDK